MAFCTRRRHSGTGEPAARHLPCARRVAVGRYRHDALDMTLHDATSDVSMAGRALGESIAAIASDAIAPGAGAAGAIALALAAACAAKAVAVTLKHRGAEPRLSMLRTTLVAFAERAVAGGDADARCFEEFTRDASPATAGALLDEGERQQRSALALKSVLMRLAIEVDSVVLADILAARALCDASLAIVSQNLASNQASRAPA
jgi:hypothetical protein